MRILLIDDEPYIIRALTLLFEHAGYEVLTAHNGADGLAKLYEERPDVVVVDMMMPRLTGLELLHQWKNEKRETEETQFIMLTGSCDEEIKEGAERFENVQLVAKPFSPRNILHLVQNTAAGDTTKQGAM